MKTNYFSFEAPLPFAICSGYRSIERQLAIWNEKARGIRPIRDENSQIIQDAHKKLSSRELLEKIVFWSAIPGCSRHHWGTDFDIFDPRALPQGQSLQLINQEYETGGIFAHVSKHMDEKMQDPNFPWYRPYDDPAYGTQKELWHYSYKPIARQIEAEFSLKKFKKMIEEFRNEMELANEILEDAEKFFLFFFPYN